MGGNVSGTGGAGSDPMMEVAMAIADSMDKLEKEMANVAKQIDSQTGTAGSNGSSTGGTSGGSQQNELQAQLNVLSQQDKALGQDLATITEAMGSARKQIAGTQG